MRNQSLTNFNVPIETRVRFDQICELAGRTRTSVLVELMESFILLQGVVLEERNRKLEQLDQTLEKSRRIMSFKEFLGSDPQSQTTTHENRSKSNRGRVQGRIRGSVNRGGETR
jgi:hypothetical protein